MLPTNFVGLLSLCLATTAWASPAFHFSSLNRNEAHSNSGSTHRGSDDLPDDPSDDCGTDISVDDAHKEEKRFRTMRRPHRADEEHFTFQLHYHNVVANTSFEGGWLDDEVIQTMVDNLNADFSSTGVNFELAEINHWSEENWFFNANKTEGLDLEVEMKESTRVGGRDTLNVWTIQLPNGPAGYAAFPWNFDKTDQDSIRDGVILKYSIIPGGRSKTRFGRTLTHEVGHWVGLYHTFQGKSCSGEGDFVDDTPMQLAPTSTKNGCTAIDTCGNDPGDDPIFNFMDYSSDECRSEFTPGQIEKIRQELATYRYNEEEQR
ncbi:hypothetical protein FA15DRAFT_691108 [Coprinopsis marcescibilis]|uniref:Peptidase M43 pregnancy-associated plasma-A domain-containing protein n=1 Tax=Coprinopsis marcescibilis TaxID=230819 RepID=A0A5C3L9S8_COPMA|nr:hypothetical protein FA15DRAFT_691108 [Coprinopsis marcescibilis]